MKIAIIKNPVTIINPETFEPIILKKGYIQNIHLYPGPDQKWSYADISLFDENFKPQYFCAVLLDDLEYEVDYLGITRDIIWTD